MTKYEYFALWLAIIGVKETSMTNKEQIRQKIIFFEKAKNKLQKKVNNNDINALFLGLANIVKKNALDEVSRDLKNECKNATQNFRQTLIDLSKAETMLKSLQLENFVLKERVEKLQNQVCCLISSQNITAGQ